jgi:hypothetical protein
MSDFLSANVIAAVSLLTYVIQRLLEIQLADWIARIDIGFLMFPLVTGLVAGGELPGWTKLSWIERVGLALGLVVSIGTIFAFSLRTDASVTVLAVSGAISLALGAAIGIVIRVHTGRSFLFAKIERVFGVDAGHERRD